MDEANGVPQDEPQPTGRRRSAAAAGASASAQPAVETQTIGKQLQRAREATGLSLEDVAERTKVRPGILKWIEADDHENLPALTYSLGFVKAFARTVGVDPLAAAEQYRRESQKSDPVPTIVDLQPLEQQRLPSRGILIGSTGAVVLALGLFWAWGAGWFSPSLPDPVEIAETEANQPAAANTTPAQEAAAVTPTPAQPDATAPVTLMAREEVWLRISDGDETFFMGTLAPGQTMTLPAGRAWKLRTGRAGALDVKVGATQIPPLGAAAQQVRDVSLTPADLLARGAVTAGGLAQIQAVAPNPSAG